MTRRGIKGVSEGGRATGRRYLGRQNNLCFLEWYSKFLTDALTTDEKAWTLGKGFKGRITVFVDPPCFVVF